MAAPGPAGSADDGRRGRYRCARFRAMASPCEVLVDGAAPEQVAGLGEIARAEAARVEAKFSRYLETSIVQRINGAGGAPVQVDEETAGLLDFAAECHTLSGGRFDITSGVLRRAWRFDGSDRVPTREAVSALLPHVGWHRVRWRETPGSAAFRMPAGMQIDLGGIGKEYAVDRVAALLAERTSHPFLVNFGGDLVAGSPPATGAWDVGIERPDGSSRTWALRRGAIATSGDAHRYVTTGGVRLGHVLDPRTGWPVENAPRSVTIAAPTCSAAGVLATLALLHGAGAEDFLAGQGVDWICERDGAGTPASI